MAIVKFYDPVQKKDISYYMDKRLKANLDNIKKMIKDKDKDFVMVIDGAEGSGKSVMALQICKYVDPTFCLERVGMTGEETAKIIRKATTNQGVQYDEGFTGLSSRAALSQINKMLVSLFMQVRQKNLFIVICIPSIFMLDKYAAMFRTKALIHVFESRNRHLFFVFNRKHKKQLLLEGSKTYSYGKSIKKMPIFKGEFRGKYPIDEKAYRAKKTRALNKVEEYVQEKTIDDRNHLIYILSREFNLNATEVSTILDKYKFPLKLRQVQNIILKMKKEKGGDDDEGDK